MSHISIIVLLLNAIRNIFPIPLASQRAEWLLLL